MDVASQTGRETPDFFVAGGTIPLGSESYIQRAADQQILDSLLSGRFCYVLNSRQMGKSSLCVRTMSRLGEQGIRCAFIDITKLGGRNVTPEQWYAGMALEIGRSLGLRTEILDYWKAEATVGPMQRFFGAVQQVVLKSSQERFVFFIDEIDSTRSLPFDTDEFFAGVRECFNRRVQEPDFERLTFCFLGVAVPSDLIKDARTTPFNIGNRIALRDFTSDEVRPLARSLGRHGEAVIERVYHWTNGHPFLTQSICRALIQHGDPSKADVDALVSRDLLEPKARETNINLSDVGNRVLNGFADGDDVDAFRADILSAYQRAVTGKVPVPDDESNRVSAVLKLSGLMKVSDGHLIVRNRIYEHVFGKKWIVENMPGQELRRQRSAFRRGALRIGLGAAAVIAVIGFLAYSNYTLRIKAEKTAREMAWRAYVADMNRLPVLFEQNNTALMEDILARHEKEPWRGVEWDYWDGRINDALWKGPGGRIPGFDLFPDGKRILWMDGDRATILNADTGQAIESLLLPTMSLGLTAIMWDGQHIVRREQNSPRGYVFDLKEKKVTWDFSSEDISLVAWQNGFSRDGRYGYGESKQRAGVVDLRSKRLLFSWSLNASSFIIGFLPDNETCVYAQLDGKDYRIVYANVKSGKTIRTLKGFRNVWTASGPSDKWITMNFADGWLRRYSVSSGKLLWQVKPTSDRLWISSESADGSVVAASTMGKVTYLYRVTDNVPTLIRKIVAGNWGRVSQDGRRLYVLDYKVSAYNVFEPPQAFSHQLVNFFGETKYIEKLGCIIAIGGDGEAFLIPKVAGSFLPSPIKLNWPAKNQWYTIEPLSGYVGTTVPSTVFFEPSSRAISLKFDESSAIIAHVAKGLALRSKDARSFKIVDLTTSVVKASFRIGFEALQDSLSLSKDGKFLVLGGLGGNVALIDCKTWKVIWSKVVHRSDVLTCRFSSDGKLLVTGSVDDTGAICRASDGAILTKLEGSAQSVLSAVFLPGDTRIITASGDKMVRLWDAWSGTELTTIGEIGDSPAFVAVSSDKKHILAGTRGGHFKAWPLPQSEVSRGK